ncbi:hypothetical protein CHR28_09120 [Streptomyces sp. XY006]|nr:hypothetical protein CHR28_09120 [Streptomyces sp. XY006]
MMPARQLAGLGSAVSLDAAVAADEAGNQAAVAMSDAGAEAAAARTPPDGAPSRDVRRPAESRVQS